MRGVGQLLRIWQSLHEFAGPYSEYTYVCEHSWRACVSMAKKGGSFCLPKRCSRSARRERAGKKQVKEKLCCDGGRNWGLQFRELG